MLFATLGTDVSDAGPALYGWGIQLKGRAHMLSASLTHSLSCAGNLRSLLGTQIRAAFAAPDLALKATLRHLWSNGPHTRDAKLWAPGEGKFKGDFPAKDAPKPLKALAPATPHL